MERARDKCETNVTDGFYQFSNNDISNISISTNKNVNLSLASQMKCDNMFSDPGSDHICSNFSVTHLLYILFLLVYGNCPLTLKRGRCRNIL